jgi:23S rRNA pseudouridine2604 synthase
VNERQPVAATEGVRLNKRMAQLGIASRREADGLIAAGRVRVDGVIKRELGVRVTLDQRIELDAIGKAAQAARLTVIIHKPPGLVSGQAEDGYEDAATLLRPEHLDPGHPWTPWGEMPTKEAFPHGWTRGLAPAGRLDLDSSGMLVITSDGTVARTLIGPERRIEKEYVVRLDSEPNDDQIRRLRFGLRLDDRALMAAQVDRIGPGKLRMVLREGRKRQIRRMVEMLGLQVVSLIRVRIGGVKLGDLERSHFRFLRDDESF